MRLVIFDVDGTLTDSAVDTHCFLSAFADVCGFAHVDSDWSRYKSVTDSGVFCEVFESHNGRTPTPSETAMFRDCLIELFRSAAREFAISAIPGAPEMLNRLDSSAGYRVAIATGCWSDSARIKMASTGMDFDLYPSASADDSMERESIVQISLQRSKARYNLSGGAVYVGDGVWDARACRTLKIPFVGIGVGKQAEILYQEGALHVFNDLTNVDGFFSILEIVGDSVRLRW